MHLAFVDIAYGYTADRPETDEPLGGTTSAVCFLARELVKKGITCTFFNMIKAPASAHGITSLPLQNLVDERSNPSITAFIFCGRWMQDMVHFICEGTTAPLIAWMHESTFNPQLVPALPAFHAISFVSEWQQRINQSFVHPHWKQAVLRNAMNPAAATLFDKQETIRTAKSEPPILLYAGSFARGAFHLPKLLEHLRSTQTDFSVEMFCNTDPSRQPEADATYINWIRTLPNITHVGMVGQPELVHRMHRAAFMIAPNPWPETSCIAMIEALAAGLRVITTDRAALPETASGFAHHIPIEDRDHPLRFDMPIDYEVFANAISANMNEWKNEPETVEHKNRTQINYFLNHYQWSQRVEPWIQFIELLTRGH